MQSSTMHKAISQNGVPIRLPDERWSHIVEGHPELAGHRNEVLLTIETPSMLLKGTRDEIMAVTLLKNNRALVTVYKELGTDGFILTAYFTSKLDKLFKRKILWRQ